MKSKWPARLASILLLTTAAISYSQTPTRGTGAPASTGTTGTSRTAVGTSASPDTGTTGTTTGTTGTTGTTTGTPPTTGGRVGAPPIETEESIAIGSLAEDEVQALQSALVRKGFSVPIDGIAGTETREALMAFQRRNGIPPSGELTTATAQKLGLSQEILEEH